MRSPSRVLRSITTATLIVAAFLAATSSALAEQRFSISFDKTLQGIVDNQLMWSGQGQTSNGQSGTVTTTVSPTNLSTSGDFVTHVEGFTFSFKTTDGIEVRVNLRGIIKNSNGRILFRGVVTTSNLPSLPAGSRANLRASTSDGLATVHGTVFFTTED